MDLLRGQDIGGLWANVSSQNRPPLPYEDTNLLRALQHTIWYLPNVDACVAMRDLLTASHNTFFTDYSVVVAAGSHVGMGARALPPVEEQIGNVPQTTKTITLSCGKLMTGVTVPTWAGILMLRELKSPESYFQAAFRVQSPWRSKLVDTVAGGEAELVHKEHCYVVDFAPNRALRQIVDYATRLRAEVASERDDEAAIDEFMEFLPVLSFDGYGMAQLKAEDVIDYLTRGISSSMLARRWNSPELLTLDLKAMEALLDNSELLESFEQIEMFRNITDDLTAMISTNKELREKKLAKEPLTKDEKKRKDDATKKRDNLKKRLQRFVTRIPAFMYLTDDREKAIKDIIEQVEPELFEKVTGLTLKDFEQLVNCKVFNDSKMNDAVWKFRTFEEPSLHYGEQGEEARTIGGWTLRTATNGSHASSPKTSCSPATSSQATTTVAKWPQPSPQTMASPLTGFATSAPKMPLSQPPPVWSPTAGRFGLQTPDTGPAPSRSWQSCRTKVYRHERYSSDQARRTVPQQR